MQGIIEQNSQLKISNERMRESLVDSKLIKGDLVGITENPVLLRTDLTVRDTVSRNGMKFSPDGSKLVVVYRNKICVFEIDSSNNFNELDSSGSLSYSGSEWSNVAWSNDGKYAFIGFDKQTGINNKYLIVLKVGNGYVEEVSHNLNPLGIHSLDFMSDSLAISVGVGSGTRFLVSRWDDELETFIETTAMPHQPRGEAGGRCVKYSESADKIAFSDSDYNLHVFTRQGDEWILRSIENISGIHWFTWISLDRLITTHDKTPFYRLYKFDRLN